MTARKRAKTIETATDAVEEVREMIRTQIKRLKDPKERITEAQRVKAIGALTNSIAMLGRITGETLEISDAKLLRLPAFRRIQEVLLQALKPHPEALRVAGEALQRFGQDQEGHRS
jgi:hypothetical protein